LSMRTSWSMGWLGRSKVVVVVVVGATEVVVAAGAVSPVIEVVVVVEGATEVVVGAGAVSALSEVLPPHAAAASEIATVSSAVEIVVVVFMSGLPEP
jgi:hypothetical protein